MELQAKLDMLASIVMHIPFSRLQDYSQRLLRIAVELRQLCEDATDAEVMSIKTSRTILARQAHLDWESVDRTYRNTHRVFARVKQHLSLCIKFDQMYGSHSLSAVLVKRKAASKFLMLNKSFVGIRDAAYRMKVIQHASTEPRRWLFEALNQRVASMHGSMISVILRIITLLVRRPQGSDRLLIRAQAREAFYQREDLLEHHQHELTMIQCELEAATSGYLCSVSTRLERVRSEDLDDLVQNALRDLDEIARGKAEEYAAISRVRSDANRKAQARKIAYQAKQNPHAIGRGRVKKQPRPRIPVASPHNTSGPVPCAEPETIAQSKGDIDKETLRTQRFTRLLRA